VVAVVSAAAVKARCSQQTREGPDLLAFIRSLCCSRIRSVIGVLTLGATKSPGEWIPTCVGPGKSSRRSFGKR
jgi:hypothetical protein